MRAGDLATPFPTVGPDTEALEAAKPLARVVDAAAVEVFRRELGGRPVAEVPPARPREFPVVDQYATVLAVAALTARTRTPLVAVVGDDGSLVGAVTVDVPMDRQVRA